MKKITLLLLLFVCTLASAQNFEGIMVYKFTAQMDEATKAKMDAAQAKMNDPETQAQMKEMKEKMNDPEFKKMMESNPQMKAQMEAMMKMADSGGDMSSMLPKSLTIKIKDQNTLTKMDGGMMANTEVLYLKGKNITYKLDRSAKTYSIMSASDTMRMQNVKITKTAETTKILGYPCTKYIAESTMQGRPMQQIFWATTAIKDLDFKSMSRQRLQGQQAMFYEKIDGVPLKIEMKSEQFGMIMEATELKKQSLPASDFVVPTDYKKD
jgi:hypothetical protein